MNAMVALRWPFPITSSGSPAAIDERIVIPPVTESHLDRLEHLLFEIQLAYEIADPVVRAFLREHDALLEVVREAADYLWKIFGREVRLELRLFQDPETGEEELFALVHMPSDTPVEDALQKLQRFDEEWFLDVQDRIDGLFNVDVVFE